MDPDEEVQGEIHLRVELLEGEGGQRLRCTVLEARWRWGWGCPTPGVTALVVSAESWLLRDSVSPLHLRQRGAKEGRQGALGAHWDGILEAHREFHPLLHRDLAKKDRNGASDPFVCVSYNGKTQESTVSSTQRIPIPDVPMGVGCV